MQLKMIMLAVYGLFVCCSMHPVTHSSVELDYNMSDVLQDIVDSESKPFQVQVSKKPQKDILGKLKNNCHKDDISERIHHKQVQKYAQQFKKAESANALVNSPEKRVYVDYIMTEVEKRNLPGALALLPMIESNFKVTARSHCGALGLWQFMPRTGRAFGLKTTQHYDGRQDLKASTHAALNYLQYLHKKFNCDWMLALAAYNAGEGTVARAMKRNRLKGKSTNFWSLKLPRETTQYVPKMLGLLQYIKQLN